LICPSPAGRWRGAKYTGRLGVCLATSGPGGIHLLNGLYDAKLDGQPVLAITGHHYHDLIDTFGQQDVDLDRVFEDVAVYNTRVMGAAHVENVAHLACRAGLPAEEELFRAAEVLNAGRRVVILAGRGALHATDELESLAETLGAPIVKALLGKAAVPDDSPYTTGGIGLLGTRPSQEAMEECDTLLMVGTSFPYMEFLPEPGGARGVQIDLDPLRIGLRYPVEVGLVGDARATLQKLLPLLIRNEDRSFLEKAQESMREWWKLMRERASRPDKPMKPQVVAWELGERLSPNAIISCDSGTITTWFARQIRIRRGQMCSLSGTLASMANGLPYTIAAQIAHPDRQCVAFVGDGGFSMLMAELATEGPVVVEAMVDPFEPPLPPKTSARQAAKFAKALAKGEPNRGRIALTVLEDKVKEMV